MPPRPWIGSVTPVAPPTEASPRLRNLVYAGFVTGIWAGVICLIGYGIGRAAGVPYEVASFTGSGLTVVSWFLVLLEPIAAGVIAGLLASLLLGRRFARRLVFWTGTLIAAASMMGPILQPADVLWSTRIWLCILHAVTWAFIVPQVARIVGDSEPGASVPRT